MAKLNNNETTRLHGLEVKEVSLVDVPANEEKFLVTKRLAEAIEGVFGNGAGSSKVRKATWTTAYINDLPDSAFLYIEPGGKKDDQGKTTPRHLRYFPVRDHNGKLDLPHLRNALSRIPQAKIPDDAKRSAVREAQRLLDEVKPQTEKNMIRNESPIVKAAQAASEKNEAEKLADVTKSYKEIGQALEVAVAAGEALAAKVDGIAKMGEYKEMMDHMKMCYDKTMSMHEEGKSANKADDQEEEEKAEEANKSAETKSEEEEKAEEANKSADAAPAAPAAPGGGHEQATIAQLRDLLAQVHAAFGPDEEKEQEKAKSEEEEKASEAEKAVAKGLNAMCERLDRLGEENTQLRKRLESFEKTQGAPRGTQDGAKTVEKSNNIWNGLL